MTRRPRWGRRREHGRHEAGRDLSPRAGRALPARAGRPVPGAPRAPQAPASPGMPSIVAEDLRVDRGGRTVLPGLSLTVPAGQVVGLLGPSGGGKSTLLRAIVGVQVVAGGAVRVLGEPAGSASLRRRVGYQTQAPSIYADLSVRDNVSYFAQVLGVGPERVATVVELVDLGDHADALVANLSGGQRGRASLACTLVGDPDVLVLDEPTVGLDPVLRRDLWALFHRLSDEGRTVLVSSHVMDEASHCDRLLLLRDGAVLSDSTLDELLSRTGTPDAERAFLALIDAAATADAATAVPPPGAPPQETPR